LYFVGLSSQIAVGWRESLPMVAAGDSHFFAHDGNRSQVTGSFTKALKLFELCESLKEH
jgi:hypothetical protein